MSAKRPQTLPDELAPARPIIFIRRVKCPGCHSTNHATIRSINQGDGSRLLWKTCRTCQEKFFVVVE